MEEVLPHYHVNSRTMSLIPGNHIDYQTIVFEPNKQILVSVPPIHIMKRACLDVLSSYEGRRSAVMHQTNYQKKVPIPIDPTNQIYAFPTHSPSDYRCMWIFYNHVLSIKENTNKAQKDMKSIITFRDGRKLAVTESCYLLEKQMQRTATCMVQFWSIGG
ncbi:competence protein ComK [Aquibacillus kalidii]|uniref:competence protein ComK n=1 Tax=Aquibacillus kalidii TaxID=2762597 RepID=UPI0016441CA6|nr:competence protein ComK [Aquibacillus kalidii]